MVHGRCGILACLPAWLFLVQDSSLVRDPTVPAAWDDTIQ